MKEIFVSVAFSFIIGACGAPSPAPQQDVDTAEPQRSASTASTNDRITLPFAADVRSAFGARGDGQTDDTAAIQAAIDSNDRVYLPKGIYLINPRIGLYIKTGTQLIGDGRSSTILLAAPGGGSASQLIEHGPGSIIRRRFTANAHNPYVGYVRLADFSIVLTHPRHTITSDAIQIAIDFRNVSRSLIERVHVGNSLPIGANIERTAMRVYDSQGYGIVLGTVPSSLPDYSGGELNVIRDSNVWGAYKGIVIDDEYLSPRSAAHGTIIENTDIQGAQILLSQESIYTRSVVLRDNILQNVIPQPNGNHKSAVIRIDGQDIRFEGGYIEAGGLANYLVKLGKYTKNVDVNPLYVSCKNKPIIINQGSDNTITYGKNCLAIAQPRP